MLFVKGWNLLRMRTWALLHPQTPFSQKSNMRGLRGNQVTHWPWHMLLNVFYYILEWAYGGKHKGWPNKPAACQSLLLSTRLTKLWDWPYIFLGHEPCVRFNKMSVNAIYKTECLCSDVKTVRDYDGEAVLFSGSRHGHLPYQINGERKNMIVANQRT